MKKFAVILAGCGVYDGAEIHEATLLLLSISKQGATYDIFAPDIKQHNVINHLTGAEMPESRNVLVEAARIARGKIKNLKEYDPAHYDALVLPGGFGVAKNLCDFAFKGAACDVNADVKAAVVSTPVSYTHLDVYKRQVNYSSSFVVLVYFKFIPVPSHRLLQPFFYIMRWFVS